MRFLVLLTFLFSTQVTFAQVKWLNMEEALAAQKTDRKKILILFYADWCSTCKNMEKATFGNAIISNFINSHYLPVRFNSESGETVALFSQEFTNPGYRKNSRKNPLHEFTQYMNVNAVPTIVFLDEEAEPITLLQGALTARELEPYLPFIAADDYKKVNTREKWDAYRQKFRSSIRD